MRLEYLAIRPSRLCWSLGSLQFPTASLKDCRPDDLFLFNLASTFGLLEPWYTFRDLGGPPLISSTWRSLGTLPERYPRYLGKLLISFLLFVETVLLSLAFNTYIASRNAQSFYLRCFVFLYGPCPPQVRLGHMMFVSLTHHSYFRS